MKSLQHALRHSMDEALRRRGLELSFAPFAALFGLYCEPGITGAKLARRTMVSAQTMNAALHRLEVEGRVERRPHPDSRRADSWYLTADGRDLLDQARSVGNAVFERMLAPLHKDEIASLESCLRRCIGALEGDRDADGAVDADDETPPPARRAIKRGSRQPEAR
jgi:DNA-binding MarR family transcriptional regulator